MKLANVQAFIAPLASPAPAALLLATEVYHILLQMEVWWLLAMTIAAVGVFGGVEASGAVAFYSATECWRRRQWGMMFFAVVAALAYVGILIAGILWLPDQGASAVVAILASIIPVSYVGVAIWQSLRKADEADEAEFVRETELMRQQRLSINATARLEKAKAAGVRSVNTVEHHTVQVDRGGIDLQTAAFEYLAQNGDVGVRPLARALKEQTGSCSVSTAKKYRDIWLAEQE